MNRVPATLISIIKLKRKIYSPDDVNPPLTKVQLWPLGPRISLEFHSEPYTISEKVGIWPQPARPTPRSQSIPTPLQKHQKM